MNLKMSLFLVLFLTGYAVFFPVLFAAEESQQEPFRVFFEGNSLTAGVKNAFGLEREGEGDPLGGRPVVWGSHIGPGMSPRQLWHKPIFNRYPYGFAEEALREYEWNALTLQPFGDPDEVEVEYCAKYIELALPKSPDIQSYVFAQWPRKSAGDYDTQWLAVSTGEGRPDYSRDRYENITLQLRQALPEAAREPRMIPVGHALHRINRLIKNEELPGYTSIYQMYRPDGLHINMNGNYVGALTFYACFYGKSPVGLGVPQADEGDVTFRPFTDEQKRIIQETVWEVVTGNHLTGITTDTPVKISKPLLWNAILKEPYRDTLHAAFGRPPYTWEVIAGELPPGIELQPNGDLRGTATGQGSFTFEVRATDEQGVTAQAEVTLVVEEDATPRITTESLPELNQGAPFEIQLEAEGGNRGVVWDNYGRLPPGFQIEPSGRLHGAPAAQGEFTFRVSAQDLDGGSPESDRRELRVMIDAPEGEVALATPFKDGLEVDGNLDEPFWEDLRYAVNKPVLGEAGGSGASARFDVAWDRSGLAIAISVTDPSIHLNESEPWLGDSVEVFFDAANDRQQVYNSDDYRFVISPDPERKKVVFGVDHRSYKSAVTRTETGYTVEIYLGHGGFHHRGHYKVRKNAVFGLDIALNDATRQEQGRTRRLVWQGTARNETNPENFGVVICRVAND